MRKLIPSRLIAGFLMAVSVGIAISVFLVTVVLKVIEGLNY